MKALRQSGKRFLGSALVCAGLASLTLTPMAAIAGSAMAHGTTMHTKHDPCEYIILEMQNTSPADFPPPNPAQEYMAVMRALAAQLRACEAQHGQ